MTAAHSEKKVGFVSLGCPKATVDSERILTQLAAAGIATTEDESDITVVNTCAFIDAARDESMAVIGEHVAAGREVIVTGCLGQEAALIQAEFPTVKHISGPAEAEKVVASVAAQVTVENDVEYLVGPAGLKLTPPHYAYLKISEGCNHRCSFCIIPSLRGDLRSRPLDDIAAEADRLAEHGTKELLVIAQDTSAYGLDLRYEARRVDGVMRESRLVPLTEVLGARFPWVRLHYVYPYPHVDDVIPLMADGVVLPYLDMPLQHAAPHILKAMRRPAAVEKVLERLERWRRICPDLAIRSTFIVGFPGETDEDFATLLDFLEAASLDRVGCFTYSAVAGAAANALPDHVPEGDKLDRQEILLEVQGQISARKLAGLVGTRQQVMIDEIDGGRALGRTFRDAPEIDGQVVLDDAASLRPGELVWAEITESTDHDLRGKLLGSPIELA